MQNFILASLCSQTNWFESYLVFLREGLYVSYPLFKSERRCLDIKCMECSHRPCRPWLNKKFTRLVTTRIRMVLKEIIYTVYV